MQENLVIVESPAKAKTIEKFLGKDFKVMSSYGHIRDLKKKEISIDLDTLEPQYEIPEDKKKLVSELKQQANAAAREESRTARIAPRKAAVTTMPCPAPRYMARTAPRPAPAETPRRSGDTRGLRKEVCRTAPPAESAPPTMPWMKSRAGHFSNW